MTRAAKELIDSVKGIEDIPEVLLRKLIFNYLADDTEIYKNLVELVERQMATKKELIQELNVNLTFSLLHMKTDPENTQQRTFRIEEARKFYDHYQSHIKTAGVHLWPELP